MDFSLKENAMSLSRKQKNEVVASCFYISQLTTCGLLQCSAQCLVSGIFGEVDWVCQHLREAAKIGGRGDIETWVESWTKLGDQVYGIGAQAAKKGHTETAVGAFQRAAVYYQWAEGFLVPSDKKATEIFAKHLDSFANFARLHTPKIEIVDIPFEGSHLKTYFVPARGVTGRRPAPAVLLSGGFDGTKEEMCFVATALSARGVLTASQSTSRGRAPRSA